MNDGIKKLSENNKTIYSFPIFEIETNAEQAKFQVDLNMITDRNYSLFYFSQGWTPKHHIFFSPARQFIIVQFLLTLKLDRENLICKLPLEIWCKIFSYLTDEKNAFSIR